MVSTVMQKRGNPAKLQVMIVRQDVEELFPTPLWTVDIGASAAVAFNATLKAEIEKIISRPDMPSGANWQTRRIYTCAPPSPISPS